MAKHMRMHVAQASALAGGGDHEADRSFTPDLSG
jgi:hypothetical protein